MIISFYKGYLVGKREAQKNTRTQIFNNILEFKNALIRKDFELYEKENTLLLELFGYLRHKEHERNQSNDKTNN